MKTNTDRSVRLEQVFPLMQERLRAGDRVVFGPKGTSMLPLLRQGVDRVELSPIQGKLKKYDLPLYIRDGGQFVLHRIVRVGETYTCIGDNQYVLEPGVREDQMQAVVTGIYRGDRYISTKALSYRIYCRYWHWSRTPRQLWRRVKGKLRSILGRN